MCAFFIVISVCPHSAPSHRYRESLRLSRFDISFANIYMVDERGRRAILTDTIGNLTKGSTMCPTLVTIPKLVSRSYVFLFGSLFFVLRSLTLCAR